MVFGSLSMSRGGLFQAARVAVLLLAVLAVVLPAVAAVNPAGSGCNRSDNVSACLITMPKEQRSELTNMLILFVAGFLTRYFASGWGKPGMRLAVTVGAI
eukprot:TRINITY_DN101284_c0_g1_i1.p2 TRINITY_DN101284_c0_g1~~TRINITY_DN101284_c0_g1_i1.p2  ORF type:complete len:100 (-),score=21.08 TRINITY_DN101284_c0_g1_i1:81-380(-)